MKLSEWRLKMNDMISGKLARLNGVADRTRAKFMGLQDRINTFSLKARNSLSSMPPQLSAITGGFTSMLTSLKGLASGPGILIALAAATALFAGKGTQMAMKFEESMAKINATALLPKEGLDSLRKELLDLGRNSTAPLEQIPVAFEKIISQTGDADLSMQILKTSLDGAKAGFVDLDVVAGAVAQSLSVIGKENANANEVLDTFFAAKRLGAGEFRDFAQYLPGLIASGANLGVQYKEVAGLFSFMTGKGQDAGKAAMLIENAFNTLSKGDIKKNLEGIGVNIFDKDGATRAMDEVFGDLARKMQGLTDEQKTDLLGALGIRDAKAKQAISILISDTQKLQDTLAGTRDAAGETNTALGATANPMNTLKEMGNEFKAFMTEVGYMVLPYVVQVLEWARGKLRGIISSTKEWWNRLEWLRDILSGSIYLSFKLIKGVLDVIGSVLGFILDNTITPIFDKIASIYGWLKDMLGWGGDKVDATVHHQINPPDSDSPTGVPGMPTPDKDVLKFLKDNGGEDDGLKDGMKGISGGGTRVRNVIVNINKVVESVNIKTQTLKDGRKELEDGVFDPLVRAIMGAELAMSND